MFCPSPFAYDRRIKELQQVMREEADAIDSGVAALNKHYEEQIQRLQEQQFTEKELNSLQVALILAKDEFDFTPADNLLKKIEQTLKNSEAKCKNCGANTGFHLNIPNAIEAWNARNHSEIPNSSIGEKIIDAIIENKLFSVINPRTNKEIKKTLVVWSSATNEILEAVVAEEICKQHKTEEE